MNKVVSFMLLVILLGLAQAVSAQDKYDCSGYVLGQYGQDTNPASSTYGQWFQCVLSNGSQRWVAVNNYNPGTFSAQGYSEGTVATAYWGATYRATGGQWVLTQFSPSASALATWTGKTLNVSFSNHCWSLAGFYPGPRVYTFNSATASYSQLYVPMSAGANGQCPTDARNILTFSFAGYASGMPVRVTWGMNQEFAVDTVVPVGP